MLSDIERNVRKNNWAVLVKNLLAELGFYEVWRQQNVCDHECFFVLLKQRVKDNFIQLWNSEINDSSRALFYRNISDFGF